MPAPIDVKSVNWATSRFHANWDGNQGASSRTLASGASATGDPRMVNVRIHEPLNPFIDNLPPPPYPFASVDLAQAKEGKAIFKEKCAGCHKPKNSDIYPASMLGVDANRTKVNTSVSRYGLAALVTEACTIYGRNNEGKPGADWCVPSGDWQARLDEYFRDTPRRVVDGTNGYKADMLHGIWAQAPYLHNGSVPTIAQLVCPSTRPAKFFRGNLHYDEALVGFEWAAAPKGRYSPNDTILVKEYDTSVAGKANTGHPFGAELCPDTTGLDPIAGSPGDSDPRARLARRRAAGVSQDAVKTAIRFSLFATRPWHSWHLAPLARRIHAAPRGCAPAPRFLIVPSASERQASSASRTRDPARASPWARSCGPDPPGSVVFRS